MYKSPKASATPRGIRNNNPGNIRVGNDWQGEGAVSNRTDRQFEQFVSLEYGYRALLITLRTYITKHKCTTLRTIITRWAPKHENDTETYIRRASEYSGILPGKVLKATDKAELCKLAYAISRVENGVYVGDLALIKRAWDMI